MVIHRLMDRNLRKGHNPRPDPELQAGLVERYRENVLQLQSLLGRDLSHWVKPATDSKARPKAKAATGQLLTPSYGLVSSAPFARTGRTTV